VSGSPVVLVMRTTTLVAAPFQLARIECGSIGSLKV
jgi:hypothetical protein